MNGNSEAERGDLQALLGMVRRRAGLIVIGFVVGVVVALGVSEQQAKKYESSAALLFRPLLIDVPVPERPTSDRDRSGRRRWDRSRRRRGERSRRRRAAFSGPATRR